MGTTDTVKELPRRHLVHGNAGSILRTDRKKYVTQLKTIDRTTVMKKKSFVQGLLLCFKSASEKQKCALPKRFPKTLEQLRKAEDIITQANKDRGSCYGHTDKVDCVEKMMGLVSDFSTYNKKC